MVVVRCLVLVCVASGGCGRFGFKEPSDDRHLHAADGWSIAPLIELTPPYQYNANDFVDTTTLSNEPEAVAALYPPFTASLVVIAGRSVIEIPATGAPVEHKYQPLSPDGNGPDHLRSATFGILADGTTGLWMTSSSANGGDGLYVVDPTWHLMRINAANSADGLAFDRTGAYASVGEPVIYLGIQDDNLYSCQTATDCQVETDLHPVVIGGKPLHDVAIASSALFITVDRESQIALDQVAIDQRTELARVDQLVLAEGSADHRLFGIQDSAAAVEISETGGNLTRGAWTDDPDWVWRAVSAPGDGHRLAGKLVVLESNRALDRDRLLLVTPPPP
jgi:hypothetical protein